MHFRFFILPFLALLSIPSFSFAQPVISNPDVLNAADKTQNALEHALSVTPPQRKAAGKALAQNPENLKLIDAWIQETSIDHPDNLKLKDLLLAMPISVSGPRLAELAKKSADPAIQASWERWLSQYPEVHASVLVAWLKNARSNPDQFVSLLTRYSALNSADALHIWVQLRANHPVSELQKAADFGYTRKGCSHSIVKSLIADEFEGEIAMLRLLTALVSCSDAHETSRSLADTLAPKISSLLSHKLPSRRIVGLDVAGAIQLKQPEIEAIAVQIFSDAQNTTERAHALRTLQRLGAKGQAQRLTDALLKGDETLRLEAANLLAASPEHGVDIAMIQTAFKQEKWPDTQFALYSALAQSMPDGIEKSQFQKQILFDASRSEALRELALQHLTISDKHAVSLDDMAKLTTDGASVNLIASTAEHIYATQLSARPTLRNWIIAQLPFERRILATFIAFLRVDMHADDASALDSVRIICEKAPEQDNLLQPCIFYLSEHAQSEADKTLLQTLQKRRQQFDAMMNFDF